jgi:hypothetical protein
MEDALPGAFYTTPTSLKLAYLALRVSRANVRRPCASPRMRVIADGTCGTPTKIRPPGFTACAIWRYN